MMIFIALHLHALPALQLLQFSAGNLLFQAAIARSMELLLHSSFLRSAKGHFSLKSILLPSSESTSL
jgi:hypothetical protein